MVHTFVLTCIITKIQKCELEKVGLSPFWNVNLFDEKMWGGDIIARGGENWGNLDVGRYTI